MREPESTLRSVCDFLKIDFFPDMLDLHASAATGGEDAYVKSRFDTKDLDRWRTELPDRDANLVEDICRPAMEAMGYPVSRPETPARQPGYWTCYRRQVAHKWRLLGQPEAGAHVRTETSYPAGATVRTDRRTDQGRAAGVFSATN